VFVSALALRDSERGHEYHERLHEFTDQIERLLMMVLLVLLGGAVAGGLLAPLGWRAYLAVALFLFLARPLAGLVSLWGHPAPLRERAAIAFFGIRGLGSLYYLAYATTHHEWAEAKLLWAVIGLTVLCSVVLHGTTVTPAMNHLDGRRKRRRAAVA
jgi:NhaP-type Na+/H+ or K+/H+ antiporter